MDYLHVGVARADITPPIAMSHAGWGAQFHQRGEGVDAPLTCTALVARQGATTVAIVDLDLIWLMPEHDQAIREQVVRLTGIPSENIRLSYTHNHSGPIVGFTWMTEGADYIPIYLASLPPIVASTVRQAAMKVQPVRVAAGRGECAINVNRRTPGANGEIFAGRNWNGFVDREVLVVRIDDLEGAPVATIVNYACHPTIMGPPNRLVTPEYPGAAKREVEAIVGGTCLFMQGATANLGPIDGFIGDPAVYRRAGKILGVEAARVRLTTPIRPTKERLVRIIKSGSDLGLYEDVPMAEADATLAVANHHVTVPLKEYPPVVQAQAEFDCLMADLVRVRASGTEEQILAAVYPVRRAELALYHAKLFGGGKLNLWIQAIQLGPVALVVVPIEPFAEIGAAVKRASPFPFTLFSGYGNGYYGYMPVPDAYPLGGYEVRTSPYPPEAADTVIEGSLHALRAL